MIKKKYLLKTFKLIWQFNKWWLLISILIRVISGIYPFITLWITKDLVNGVINLIKDNTDIKGIINLLILQTVLTIFISTLKNIQIILDEEAELKFDYYIGKIVYQKSLTVPYYYFEYSDFYNHHDRINGNFGNKIMEPIRKILDTIESFINALSYIGFLWFIHWMLVLLSIVTAIPLLKFQNSYSQKKFFLMRFQTPVAREINYIGYLLHNHQHNKEIRLFGIGDYLLNRWVTMYKKNSKDMINLLKRERTGQIILDLITNIIYGFSGLFVVLLIKKQRIGVGEFVTVGQAFLGAQSSINKTSINISKVYEKHLYLKDLFDYLDFNISTNTLPKYDLNFPHQHKGIKVEKMSFNYPNSNLKVLNNVNFEIKPGERIAIVGENGSGKTTLIKCIMGLYKANEGNIFINGRNIDNYNLSDLYKKISVIFQDFNRYAFSINDNILFGDITLNKDDKKIVEVIDEVGLQKFIEDLPDKYDTKLGKVLGEGVDISGGQWQRIALARALLRNSEIIILDEPTSALDPQTELAFFDKINKIIKNKSVLFISHRMASAKMADRIIVMKNGQIIEEGTHDELFNLRQEYYSMYNAQAKWYDLTVKSY